MHYTIFIFMRKRLRERAAGSVGGHDEVSGGRRSPILHAIEPGAAAVEIRGFARPRQATARTRRRRPTRRENSRFHIRARLQRPCELNLRPVIPGVSGHGFSRANTTQDMGKRERMAKRGQPPPRKLAAAVELQAKIGLEWATRFESSFLKLFPQTRFALEHLAP